MQNYTRSATGDRPVWAYCRGSSNHERPQTGLDEQIGWARAFARERGAALEIFRDRGPTSPDRAGLLSLMAALKDPRRRKPALVVVTSLDRLSRNLVEVLEVWRALRRVGAELYVRRSAPSGADRKPPIKTSTTA